MSKKQTAGGASLPRDDDSAPIQILSPDPTGSVFIISTEGASSNVALPANTNILRIGASGSVVLAFGNASVDAGLAQTDSFIFPAGAEVFFLRDTLFTHVAARSLTGAGTVNVSCTRME